MSKMESTGPLAPRSRQFLNGKTVRIYGPLQSMSLRNAAKLIREHGGTLVPSEGEDSPVDWIIIGESQQVFTDSVSSQVPEWLTDQLQEDIECGLTHIATETQLLQRLFPSEDQSRDLTALYTPVMLAELLKVTVSDVRRWYQRGLIAPVRVIKRLPYFNLTEVFSARRLSLLLQNGVKHPSIEKKLKALRSLNPGVLPLLASNDLVIQGKNVYLRQNEHLVESTGQLLLDFEAIESEQEEAREQENEAQEPQQLIPGRVEDFAQVDSFHASGTLASVFLRDEQTVSETAESTLAERASAALTSDLASVSDLPSASAGTDLLSWTNPKKECQTDFVSQFEADRRASFVFDSEIRGSEEESVSPKESGERPLEFLEKLTERQSTKEREQRISIAQMRASALALDEAGKLAEAEEMWRNILFASGGNVEDAFQLGDVLHRAGNLQGARERFSMAVEMDEDFVEARASLGCVLGELGEIQLAISALEGAVSYHSEYAEAYYHLARFLEQDGNKNAACLCYRKFLELADSCTSLWHEEAEAKIREFSESEQE